MKLKENKTLKVGIISSLITAIIFSGIVVAAVTLSAKDIGFTSTNEGWNATNVEEAMNDLYKKTNSYKFVLNSDSNSDIEGSAIFEFHDKKYKYFKITSLIKDSNVGICYITGWSSNKSQQININLNQEYEILSSDDDYKFSAIAIQSNSVKKIWSRCYAQIELYN